MVTKRQKLEAREQAILEAARDVFTSSGYEKGRIAEVARKAGVAEGTIYLYYKTKQDLVRAVINDYWSRLTLRAKETVDPSLPFFKQLEQFARFHVKAYHEDIDYIDLNLAMRVQHLGFEAPVDMIRSYVRIFDDMFTRACDRGDIQSDVPLWVARDLFFGTLEHSSRSVFLDRAKSSEDCITNLMTVFRATYTRSTTKPAPLDDAIARLEDAVSQLKKL
ncbi:Fatty acid metabolism regulator protein [Shimia thalassica]|uniref:Fatty acid metabolism regulator protein n=1 Tax=Shimia thalassica TaxID=1715693 RepID=A0A0P1I9H8_9RHOB|nr:TetR/AcrR family transcriptional regulator [Shimia thalassica]CUJ99666.1 Fatty acid metabolism regulator protein [Shimia thalassica]